MIESYSDNPAYGVAFNTGQSQGNPPEYLIVVDDAVHMYDYPLVVTQGHTTTPVQSHDTLTGGHSQLTTLHY